MNRFTFILQVVEAEQLPYSQHGTRPDPFVTVELLYHSGSKQQTVVIPSSTTPVWNHKFILSSSTPSCVLSLTVLDGHESPERLIGQAELALGGPGRCVGSKWLQLDGRGAKLHVLWELQQDDGYGSTAAPHREILKAPESASTVEFLDSTKGSYDATPKHERVPAAPQAFPNSNGDVSVVAHEAIVNELTARFEGRFVAIETRLLELESWLLGNHALRGGLAGKGLQVSSVNGDTGGEHARTSEGITPVATAAVALRLSAQAVADIQRDLVDDAKSALESITKRPTRLTAEDEQLLAAYHANSVWIPPTQLTSRTPLAADVARGEGSALDRRLEAAKVSVAHNSHSFSSTF